MFVIELIIRCILVLFVEFHFVWSTRYSRCFCVCIALSYLDVVIKDYYFEVSPRLHVPRFSLLCAPWQKTRPNSKHRHFTSFCFVHFFKWLFCSCVLSLMPAVRRSLRRRLRLSHPTVRGSSREFTPPFVAQPSRRSREFTPPFAAQPSRRSREFTPPFADQPAHRSQEMTPPPSTANPSPPARRWINARRPASDSMPAGPPLTQARWIAADSSPPDRRWLKLAGLPLTHARWPPFAGKANSPHPQYHAAVRGSPTPPFVGDHAAVRGESQPAVRGHSARRRLWLPPARRPPLLSGQASRLWSRQPVVAVFDQTVTKVFLIVSSVFSPGGLRIPLSCPIDFFWGGTKVPAVVARPRDEATATRDHLPWPPELPAAPWPPSVCSALEAPSCVCLCVWSWGVSRVPTPPPW